MTSGGQFSKDHVKSLVETYRPAFQMLFTSRRLFKQTSELKKFFRLGEKLPEHKKFRRRSVQLCSLDGWECDGIEGPLFLLSIDLPEAEALRLAGLVKRPGIASICSVIKNDDAMHITLFGSKNLALFLKESGEFIRDNFPDFNLPYSLDTEILFRPEKACYRKYACN